MAIQLFCPNLQCRKILAVPDEVRGKNVQCEQCRTTFRVPEARKGIRPVPTTAAK